MAEPLLWAIGTELPVKVLAVVGGAALGAFLGGWLTGLVTMAVFRQQLPRWPAWGIRGMSGLILGWLVALWVFGGGGGGIGGEGGWGLGSGKGTGQEKEGADKFVKADGDKDKSKKQQPAAAETETLHIEVLGDAPLKKIAKDGVIDPGKRYRVAGETELRTLPEVQDIVRRRRRGTPALKRLDIILYQDSPARERPQVANLADWASDLEETASGRLMVDFAVTDRYAPVEGAP